MGAEINGSWVQWEWKLNGSKQRKQRKSRGRKQKSERRQHQPYIFFLLGSPESPGDAVMYYVCMRRLRSAASRLLVAIVWVSGIYAASTAGIFSIFMLLFGVNLRDESREIQMGVCNLDDVMFLAVTKGPSPGFLYTRLCVFWCTMTSGCVTFVEVNQRISRRTAVFPM